MQNIFTKKKPTSDRISYLPIRDILLHRDFKDLFPINRKVRDSIVLSIRKEGFNEDYPLLIWTEENVLIDGHTRLSAAKRTALRKVPVAYKSFSSKQEALDYALSLQFNRRNLTDADLFSFVLTLDTDNLPGPGRKQDKLAKVANISVTKAMRIIKVKKEASGQLKAQILDGSSSINSIYNKVNGKKGQMNSRKKKSSKKLPQSLQIDPGFLEEKVDEWLSVFRKSDGTDLLYIQRVEAVLEILPAGKFKSSLIMKLPDDYGSP